MCIPDTRAAYTVRRAEPPRLPPSSPVCVSVVPETHTHHESAVLFSHGFPLAHHHITRTRIPHSHARLFRALGPQVFSATTWPYDRRSTLPRAAPKHAQGRPRVSAVHRARTRRPVHRGGSVTRWLLARGPVGAAARDHSPAMRTGAARERRRRAVGVAAKTAVQARPCGRIALRPLLRA